MDEHKTMCIKLTDDELKLLQEMVWGWYNDDGHSITEPTKKARIERILDFVGGEGEDDGGL